MNLKKIQILSAPRMGTTVLHRVLSQINWDSESKTNQHSAEILNNAEETTTELEYIKRINDILQSNCYTIKIQMTDLRWIEGVHSNVLDLYRSTTHDSFNILLIRKNLIDTIMSYVIANTTQRWTLPKELDQPCTISEHLIHSATETCILNLNNMLWNRFNIKYSKVMFYEDHIMNKTPFQIYKTAGLPVDDRTESILQSAMFPQKNISKKLEVSNYDQSIDIIKRSIMHWNRIRRFEMVDYVVQLPWGLA